MTFKDLKNILRRQSQQKEQEKNDVATTERAKLIEFDTQLREAYLQAYTKRRDNWFATHPENEYFEPSLEEDVRDTEFSEWIWYFYQHMKQTPEQRYQNEKNQVNGFGHGGVDGDIDSIEGRECKPGCRFYPLEGRIEAIEVLHYYEKYQGFAEVLASWNAITS